MRPYREPTANRKKLVSEFTILVVTNFLLTSSIASIDVRAREWLGWAIIVVIGFILTYS